MLSRLPLLLLACVAVAKAADWTHAGEHGVDHWAEMFATCAGSSQSPIDLKSEVNDDVFVYDETLTNTLDIVKAQTPDNYYLVNNGHTVYVDTTGAEVSVLGAKLGKEYSVIGPHFHWGSVNGQGSEHTFNEVEYPLEMHIVTFDAVTYANIGEAVGSNEAGALAVVGVMFQLSEEDNPALAPIIDNIASVQHPDKENKVPIPFFELKSLLPAETSEYFRYSGSLTTPTCNEVVTWTVLLHPQPVSQRQLDAFRSLHESHADGKMTPLVDNYRPVQPLNGRKVYKSFQEPSIDLPGGEPEPTPTPEPSAATQPLVTRLVMAVAMAVAMVMLH